MANARDARADLVNASFGWDVEDGADGVGRAVEAASADACERQIGAGDRLRVVRAFMWRGRLEGSNRVLGCAFRVLGVGEPGGGASDDAELLRERQAEDSTDVVELVGHYLLTEIGGLVDSRVGEIGAAGGGPGPCFLDDGQDGERSACGAGFLGGELGEVG